MAGLELKYAREEYTREQILSLLDEDVAAWFSKFPKLTLPQLLGIPHIAAGERVLISAPTGSGKTLAAFACIISELFKLAKSGELEDQVYCVYVSPLRALDNDTVLNVNLST